VDDRLKAAWIAESEKYPSVVKDVLAAAMSKAQEVRRNAQQSAIRDEVIELLRAAIKPEGGINDELIVEIAEWEQGT
jgi:hypothetical protein